jgi:hypothetical protein
LGGAVVALSLACNEQRLQGGFAGDLTLPIVSIQKTAGDTLTVDTGIQFEVSALDNLGLRNVTIELSGGVATTIDSTFNTAVTTVTVPVDLPLDVNSTAGGPVIITATAVDGNDNAASVVDSVFLVNERALVVRVLNPTNGAVTSAGRQLPVRIVATQAEGVTKVGYITSGVFNPRGDSTSFTVPFPDSTEFLDTLTVPSNAAEGTFTITGFAEDTGGRRGTSAPVSVTIQSAANDNTGPAVDVTVGERVEVEDSVTVHATDPSGITLIGWTAVLIGSNTLVGGDSTALNGNLTDVTETFPLGFNFADLPETVVITGFAVDDAGNRATTADASAPAGVVSAARTAPPAGTRRRNARSGDR